MHFSHPGVPSRRLVSADPSPGGAGGGASGCGDPPCLNSKCSGIQHSILQPGMAFSALQPPRPHDIGHGGRLHPDLRSDAREHMRRGRAKSGFPWAGMRRRSPASWLPPALDRRSRYRAVDVLNCLGPARRAQARHRGPYPSPGVDHAGPMPPHRPASRRRAAYTQGLRGMSADRQRMGAPSSLSHLRPRRLLRQLAEQARDEALPRQHHPVVRSFERGEDWAWCYVDQLLIEPAPF